MIIVDPYSGEAYTVPDVTPTAEELRKITVPYLTQIYDGVTSLVTPSTPSATGGSNVGVVTPNTYVHPITPSVVPPVVPAPPDNPSSNAWQNNPFINALLNGILPFRSFFNNMGGSIAAPTQPSAPTEFSFLGLTGMPAILMLLILIGGIK